ncbi:bifunctional diguanylate cyclase/phosphodiesterase [Hydrogenophaga aquatica]
MKFELAQAHAPVHRSRQHWALAGLVFLSCALLFAYLIWHTEQRRSSVQRATALSIATEQAQVIESRIQRLMSATYLLAAIVRKDGGEVRQFEEVASQILPFYPGVQSLALSPGGVIRHAVPLGPNIGSIGFNQLADPAQSPEAFLARDTGRLTLAGPLNLAQGGVGAVGRLPIFLPDDKGQEAFWGFANVIIRFPDALASTGMDGLPEQGYDYELWRIKPDTGTRQVIAASPGVMQGAQLHEPVERTLRVPNGQWTLSLAPRGGWNRSAELGIYALAALVFSGMLSYLLKLVLDQKLHRLSLEEQVMQRTLEIRSVQDQLQATLDAIPDLLFELDMEGRQYRVHALDESQLIVPAAQQLGGRFIHDILPAEACATITQAMRDAQLHGRSSGRQYTLPMPDGIHWYELSVSCKALEPGQNQRFILLTRDITERKRTEADLILAAKVFQQSSEAFLITDAQKRIIKVNPAFTEITGYTPQDVIGKTPRVLASGRHGPGFYQRMWRELQRHGEWQGEVWNRRRNGEVFPEWLSITRVQDDDGQTTHYIAIFTDTTLRKAQEAKIRNLAFYDSLTGLANRTLLKDRVQHDLSQAKRHQSPLSLLFIDLDHFKNINDSLGHQIGDGVLIEVARRIQSLVREQDTVARLGGDEFVALLPDTAAEGAAHMARKLLELVARPYQVDQQELTVTPSIGIALFPDDGADFETLYRCADTAMYRAKQEGRNGYSFFTHEMQAHSIRRLQLENALRRALERQQLSLHYQPQVNVSTGEFVGIEALLRWNHPEWGPVSPAEFIPVAESSGQILAIGEWVLRTAAAQVRRWMDEGLPPMVLAVNLSAVQFRQPQLPAVIVQILQDTGLPPGNLELELTESAAMHDPEGAIETMNALHGQGILMSVDDFGTGYSSLNYLKRFQVYKLKIDQSFVQDVTNDPEDASIVAAIVRMAHSLGLKVIAEGVETQAQLDFLRDQGCDEMQGYYLARPLPPNDFEAWLRGRLSPPKD